LKAITGWAGGGQFSMFLSSYVNFVIGGEPKFVPKLDGGHGRICPLWIGH